MIHGSQTFLTPQADTLTARKALELLVSEGSSKEDLELFKSAAGIEDTYIEDNYLPKGWKAKKGNFAKPIFVSPSGESYNSRILALKSMVEQGSPCEEVDRMVAGLEQEGWLEDTRIPRGWRIKETVAVEKGKERKKVAFLTEAADVIKGSEAIELIKSRGGSTEDIVSIKSLTGEKADDEIAWKSPDYLPEGWKTGSTKGGNQIILCPSGFKFKSMAAALRYMTINNFPQKDIDKMRGPLKAKLKVDDGTVWERCDSLPEGWKVGAGRDGHQWLLGPGGYKHRNRRVALRYMVQSKAPEGEVEEMRAFLGVEGWKKHAKLPANWMMKIRSEKIKGSEKRHDRKLLASEEGLMFEAITKAIKHMEQSNKYKQEEIDDVKSLSVPPKALKVSKELESVNIQWTSNDLSVPEGWKVGRTREGEERVRCLDGSIHLNRRKALKYLVDSNWSEEKVEELRGCLEQEGWAPHPQLPSSWRIKPNMKPGVKNKWFFLLPNGRTNDNLKRAVLQLKKSGCTDIGIKENTVIRDQINERKVLNLPVLKAMDEDVEWKEGDETVPSGWKVGESKEGKQIIKGLDGVVFFSRRHALRFMVAGGFPEDDINKLRGLLGFEGWKEDDMLLPSGWMFKKKNGKRLVVMNQKGKLFDSLMSAVRFMEASNDFTNDQIGKAKQLSLTNMTAQGKAHKLQWVSDDPTVPAGWKVNNVKDAKLGVLSPTGLPFIHRGQALQHMLKGGFPSEEVEEMRGCLEHEGWREHHVLPEGWRIKDKASLGNGTQAGIRIMTPTGKHFDSSVKAIDHMKNLGNVDVEDLRKIFNGKIDWFGKNNTKIEKSKTRKENDSIGWKVHPKLPAGWKVKGRINSVQNGHYSKVVFCLEGQSGPMGRLAAIKLMKSSADYGPKDVAAVRKVYLELGGKAKTPKLKKRKTKIMSSDDEWVCGDASVPAGWKISRLDERFGRRLQSPAGVECRNRSTRSRTNPWQYMTPRGKFFHVLASARKYMQAYGGCDFKTPKLRKSARKEPDNNEDIQSTEKMEIKEDIKVETDEDYSGIHFMKSEECTEMKNELKLEETEKIEDVKMETEYYDFIDDNDFAEMKSEVKEEVKLEKFDNIDDLSTFDNLLQRNIGQ